MNPEPTPGFAVWDSCRTAGAEESASSQEVTLLALCCCFRAESNIHGGRNDLAKDSIGPPFTLNPLRTVAFPKSLQETEPPLWHSCARSPSAAGAGGAALPALGARSGATGKTGSGHRVRAGRCLGGRRRLAGAVGLPRDST